jgi:hypothetical protein
MAAIISYKVGVTRSRKPGPARWITLQIEQPTDGVQSITMFFYEKDLPELGYLNPNNLVINLPLADFNPTYQILQTERPVYAHYRLEASERRVLSLDVSTSEEPLGEGHVDQSP